MNVLFLACLVALVAVPAVHSQGSGCLAEWIYANGIGGTEAKLAGTGTAGTVDTFEECVQLVHATKPYANGVTYSEVSKGCWAEFDQTSADPSTKTYYQNCYVEPRPQGCIADWIYEDGIGGSEANIGTADTFEECVQLVQATKPYANGVTFAESRKTCWAEFDQTSTDPSTNNYYQNCYVEPQPLDEGGADDSSDDDSVSVDDSGTSDEESDFAFDVTPGMSGAGATCYVEDDLHKCQEICWEMEGCFGIDWNHSANPWCHCWIHEAEPGPLSPNANVDHYMKAPIS